MQTPAEPTLANPAGLIFHKSMRAASLSGFRFQVSGFCVAALIVLALSPVARAQLVFTQSATVTLTDAKVIGVAYSPTDSLIYVAAEGSVQPYDLSFTTAGSNIADLAGIQNYMNLGPTGTLTFSTLSSGLKDMNISDSTDASGYFGSGHATSFSRQVTFGTDSYLVYYDSNFAAVRLYNRTADTSSTILTLAGSGLSDIAAVDFGYTGSTTTSSFFFAASSAGQIAEYSLAGTATGNSGSLALIGLNSNDAISGLSYNSGSLSYSVYNPDFNASVVNFGTFTGTAIPEPSTYAVVAGLSALGFGLIRRRIHSRR